MVSFLLSTLIFACFIHKFLGDFFKSILDRHLLKIGGSLLPVDPFQLWQRLPIGKPAERLNAHSQKRLIELVSITSLLGFPRALEVFSFDQNIFPVPIARLFEMDRGKNQDFSW